MKNKLTIFIIIPIVILSLMSIIFVLRILFADFTPRMFFYEQNVEDIQHSDAELSFRVTSLEDYLGIISLDHINTLIPVNTNKLTFRIINANSGLEVGINSYPIDNVFDVDTIPFGIAVQTDSKNQIYQIILTAICSSQPCEFRLIDSTVILRHYFPKRLFISNPPLVLNFLSEKLLQGMYTTPLSEYYQIFLFPQIIYFALILLTSDSMKKLALLFRSVDTVNLMIILTDVIFQLTPLFWFSVIIFIYRMRKQQPAKFIVLITITFISTLGFYLSGLNGVASRISMWSFISAALYLLRLQQK